jgi:hypothetical protein
LSEDCGWKDDAEADKSHGFLWVGMNKVILQNYVDSLTFV